LGNNAGAKENQSLLAVNFVRRKTLGGTASNWPRSRLTSKKLDFQIAKLKEFIKGGNVGEAQPFQLPPARPIPQDQLNQLEKKTRQTDARKDRRT